MLAEWVEVVTAFGTTCCLQMCLNLEFSDSFFGSCGHDHARVAILEFNTAIFLVLTNAQGHNSVLLPKQRGQVMKLKLQSIYRVTDGNREMLRFIAKPCLLQRLLSLDLSKVKSTKEPHGETERKRLRKQ